MAASSKSISLPCRSHPTTLHIEELLRKMKITSAEATSSDAICSGLSQMKTLYGCMDDLLASSTNQILMSQEQNKKWVNELVDESVMFLDICGSISDMLSESKEHSRDIYSSLRRRKGDLNVENSITKYSCFRKKMKKDVKGLVASLKQVDNMITGAGSVVVDSDNHQLVAVIRALIGVSEMTVLVFESLLMFLSMPVSKQNTWSIVVSKLVHKRRVACEDHQEQVVENEFERVDEALRKLCEDGSLSDVQIAQCKLETLGAQIERMESGLECMFRCLVQTRVSLLNIISK
ncbi:hypothetical protein CTI12_AA157380 [Artemisia annua]|uniref:DUF241 domain protein n=1 Tax=Artemisia annua TaxID=35608 RepID=A0A2U1PG28_ARTAN|nr:hypothetical protein CTI12_AA157380 [Artemisia annua]